MHYHPHRGWGGHGRMARHLAGHAGFGRGRHGGGRGGMGRMFDHGDLRLIALALIAEKPRHGYELIKELEERSGGAYSPSPGVIYPTLTLLAELNYIAEAGAEGAKRLFAITPEGEAFLTANRGAVDAILGRFGDAGAAGMSSRFKVRYAMESLKHVLKGRFINGELGEADADKIIAILENASEQIANLNKVDPKP